MKSGSVGVAFVSACLIVLAAPFAYCASSTSGRAAHSAEPAPLNRSARLPQATSNSASSKTTPNPTPRSSSVSSKKKKTTRKGRSVANRQPTQKAPTADRISEIQSALARTGYYKGDPNGKMDPDTIDALQKFQSTNGLEATGKLDALSLQKLGLGSDIAGVSAPKGAVPRGCCSISPSSSLIGPRTSSSPAVASAAISQPKPASVEPASPVGGSGSTAASTPSSPKSSNSSSTGTSGHQ